MQILKLVQLIDFRSTKQPTKKLPEGQSNNQKFTFLFHNLFRNLKEIIF